MERMCLGRGWGTLLLLLGGSFLSSLPVAAAVAAVEAHQPPHTQHNQHHHPHEPHNGEPHNNNNNNNNNDKHYSPSEHEQQHQHQGSSPPLPSLLMIGNSFTEANDLSEVLRGMLVQTYRRHSRQSTFSSASSSASNLVHVQHYSPGGARLSEAVRNRQLRATIIDQPWTWVVLQEQSQIPAFVGTRYDADFQASVNATRTLHSWIMESAKRHKVATTTVLFLTWARRGADWGWNPTLFPDFNTMQDMLTQGYTALQASITSPETLVPLAPVGVAFRQVYNVSGRNAVSGLPTNASAHGTAFTQLYQPDNLHPSIAGTYLAACTIYATLLRRDDCILDGDGNGAWGVASPGRLQVAAATAVDTMRRQNVVNRQYYAAGPMVLPRVPLDEKGRGWSMLWRLLLVLLAVVVTAVLRKRYRASHNDGLSVGMTKEDSTEDLELVDLLVSSSDDDT